MKKTVFLIIFSALLLEFLGGWEAFAVELTSTSFKITTSVSGGGGGRTSSPSFSLNATIGQPTPLADDGLEPASPDFTLYPGYWHTLGSCKGDYDMDGDVDGLDLAGLASRIEAGSALPSDLEDFAGVFGRTGCK